MIRSRWFAMLMAVLAAGPLAAAEPVDTLVPNDSLKIPFAKDTPIVFVTRNANAKEWAALPQFWNEGTQKVVDPTTGMMVERKTIQIKVPLGLSAGPAVPAENPMTLAKWKLGKKLYFDPVLSTDGTISCATCHDPKKGYTDQSRFSTGINNNVGGANAPTVLNSAYNRFQFWDGRAASLEDQSQGPPTNPKEMFAGKGDAWAEAIGRIRANPEWVKEFQLVFGHSPTRDAVAKAIATYERTVLVGNSIYDRAEAAMKRRVADDDTGEKPELKAVDFATVLKEAVAKKDAHALRPFGDAASDTTALGQKLLNGRNLFFNKARCTNCHIGENFTDGLFHNLGVGVQDGHLPASDLGRFGSLPTGHKDASLLGAFKTPGLRGLSQTAPYMHDGSEKTLEAVVEYYDKGGNANPYLAEKMRDTAAEAAYVKAKAAGQPVDPNVKVFTSGGWPIIPFQLKLTKEEKADLVLFLKSLESDSVDPMVADPAK